MEWSGFTYNGIHSEDLGLYYLPTEEDRWFNDPEYDVYSSEIEWRHGGVYYDSKAKIRTFTLKCFFETIDVAKRQAIKAWVKYNTSGKLIFDDMPFVYWNVRPGKIPVGNWYVDGESYSGTVEITFEAYEPFGYLTRKYNTNQNLDDHCGDYCSLIDASDMPSAPTTSSTLFEIYNPGTEECGLSIEFAGTTSNPFRFYNVGNGTFCVFKGIPSGRRLMINGDTGLVSTYLANSSNKENGFAYHDKGVVRIDPNIGRSNIPYINGNVSNSMYTLDLLGYQVVPEMKGIKVTLQNNSELLVNSVNVRNNQIICTASGSVQLPETGTCSFKNTNTIVIHEKIGESWVTPSTLNLTYLKVDYNPKIS